MRFYGLDLLDLGGERLTWRRASSLISLLPAESATVAAATGGDNAWGLKEQLLAAAVDSIRQGNWQRGGGKGPRPKPIPRPGAGPTKRQIGGGRKYTTTEMRRLLDRSRRGEGS